MLIELLVLFSIIAILAGDATSSAAKVRLKASGTGCFNKTFFRSFQ
jgi:hypothetical protein